MNLHNRKIEIDLEDKNAQSSQHLDHSDEYDEEKFDTPEDVDEHLDLIGSNKPSARKSQPLKRKVEYDEDRKSSGSSTPPPIDQINSAQFVPTQGTQSTTKLPYYPIKIGNKTVEQLLIHNIDTSVKPIIGNKEIEKVYDLRF